MTEDNVANTDGAESRSLPETASTSEGDLEAGTSIDVEKGKNEDSPTEDKTTKKKPASDAPSSSSPSSRQTSSNAGSSDQAGRSGSTGAAVTSMPGAFAVDNPLADDPIRESFIATLPEASPTTAASPFAAGIQTVPVVVAEAVEQTPTKESKAKKTTEIQGYVAVVLVAILAIVVVVLSVILSKRRSANTTKNIDLELRRSDMIAFLGELSPPEVFDPTHPDVSVDRIAALNWIVEEDGLQLPIPGSSSSGGDGDEDDDAAQTLLERYALALFYFATNGDGWELKNNFLSPFYHCSWNSAYTVGLGDSIDVTISTESQGIICNDDGQITQVRMWWNNISGTIPNEISVFSETLELLNLVGGSIGGTIPSAFASFSKLDTFAVSDNCMTGTIPEGFDTFKNMSLFMVHNNYQLDGSLQGFCEDEPSLYREGIGFVARDANVDCSCCNQCDPVGLECENLWFNFSFPTVYTSDMNAWDAKNNSKQFTKQCISSEQNEWIDEQCPCVIDNSLMTEVEHWWECTQNCTIPGAWPSHNN